jgi:RNA polymerase sigma factor (sigma-70 family)
MQQPQSAALLRFVRNLKHLDETRTVSDRELLRRFLGERDQAAFHALVRRHGPMVFRVCLRVLQSEQDAEDVFQATFLVLAKRAGVVRRQDSVGSWLFGVAHRLACKAKRTLARRRAHERQAAARTGADALTELSVREAQELVDGEIGRLPERYRGPFVLCCLEGATRDEAARQLGLTLSTLKKRLELGRQLLRGRLRRRGLTLSGALLAAALGEDGASAAVPSALADATSKAATSVAAGGTTALVVSARAAALTEGEMRAMLLTKLKIAVCVLLVVGCVSASALVRVQDSPGAGEPAQPQAAQAEAPRAGGVPAVPDAPGNGRIYVSAGLRVKPEGQDEEKNELNLIIAIDPATGKWQKIADNGHSGRVSPDRQTLAFSRHDDGIWSCDTGGGNNPGRISDNRGRPVWSPDGKYLVATTQELVEKDTDKKPRTTPAWKTETWRMEADGRNAVKLPIPDTDWVEDWSPDGQWFVVGTDRHPPYGHGYQLYLMQTDGTQARRLTRDGLNVYARFSPDGKKILYLHQTAKAGNSIWTVDVDGQNARELVKEVDLASPDSAYWSPDGKQIAVVLFNWQLDEKGRKVNRADSDAADFRIELMDADGMNRRRMKLEGARFMFIGALGDWR